ncbi:MAG: T9SS type A sorting domain-containing protein [Bacteroidota bacterium]|nr:T9SS type A sorting domain-containing protein [Bacteroidota bacterium]
MKASLCFYSRCISLFSLIILLNNYNVFSQTLTASTTSLTSFGTVNTNSSSSSQNYTLTGSGLIPQEEIYISPSASYEVSLDNVTFDPSGVVVNADDYGDISITVYVRFAPITGTAGGTTISGNIDNYASGSDIDEPNPSVSGKGKLVAPVVTTTSISSIKTNEAYSGGVATANAVTGAGVCWSTSYNPVRTGSHTTDAVGTGSFSSHITGLTVKTRYYVRAYAYLSSSTGYGTNKFFWTLATEPTFQCGSLSTGAITSSSIDLSWPSVATADGYIILTKLNSLPDNQGITDGISPSALTFPVGTSLAATITTGTTTSTTISGLAANQNYYFVILPYAKGTNDSTYNYKTDGTLASANATTAAVSSLTSTCSGNWGDASTWGNVGIPSSTTNVTISSGHTITVGVIYNNNSCNNLTINDGGALTLTTSKNLTVNGNLVIKSPSGTGVTGSLIDNGTLTVVGTTTVQRYISGATTRTWYISSPVSNATASTIGFPDGTDSKRLFTYSVTTNQYSGVSSGSTPLTPMQGFSFRERYASSPDNVFQFTGNLNTGSVSINLTSGGTGAGWNLVGNPYPSAIDWKASSGWTKNKISNQFCFRTNGTWSTYNGTSGLATNGGSQYIPAMQGFWVKDTASGGSLGVTNAVRVHNTQVFYKSANEGEILHLKVQNDTISDEAIIGFMNGAKDSHDAYDTDKFLDTDQKVPQIYTKIGKIAVAANVSDKLDGIKIFPIRIRIGVKGNYNINASGLNNFDEGTTIILKDLVLNNEQDLKTNPKYSFTSDIVADSNRFEIIISSIRITALSINPICDGDSVILSATSNPNYKYSWKLNGENISGANLQTYTAKKAGSYIVEIKDILTGNNKNSAPFNVIVNKISNFDFSLSDVICTGIASPIKINGTYDTTVSYKWNFDEGIISQGSDKNPSAVYWINPGIKNITLSITKNGCNSPTITRQIDVKNIPVMTTAPYGPNNICINTDKTNYYLITSEVGATKYFWDISPHTAGTISGEDTLSKVIWNPNFSGKSIILAKGINECGTSQPSAPLQIVINPSPIVNLGKDTTILSNQTIVLDAGKEFNTYLWSDNSTAPTIIATSNGNEETKIYSVTVTDQHGCKSHDSLSVTFKSISGISINQTQNQITIKPNLTKEEIEVFIGKPIKAELIILNSIGQEVFSKQIYNKNSNTTENLNLGNLKKGIYFVKISGIDINITKKIILQ